jgi:hypothetical protein
MSESTFEKAKRIKGYGFPEYLESHYKDQLTRNSDYELEDDRKQEAERIGVRADNVPVKPVVIQSLQEYINVIVSLKSSFAEPLFYRGQTDANKLLIPYVLRDNPSRENLLIEEFQRRFSVEIGQCKTAMDKLVLMQHYGLQTRCFDLSENPFVAMYYASQDMKKFHDRNSDANKYKWGEVIIFKECGGEKDMKNPDSSTTSIIANTAFLDEHFSLLKLGMLYKNDYHFSFDEKYIRFRDIIWRSVIVRTPQINPRIKNQAGAFVLVNSNEFDDSNWTHHISLSKLTNLILKDESADEWWISINELRKGIKGLSELKDVEVGDFLFKKVKPYDENNNIEVMKTNPFDMNRLLYQDDSGQQVVILVPPTAKQQILKQLEKLGITEAFVYPEMDSVANELNWRI